MIRTSRCRCAARGKRSPRTSSGWRARPTWCSGTGPPTEVTVVVITGASSGIGAATAELLAHRGMSVVPVARRKAALDVVAARCGGRAHAIVADMTVRAEVRRVVDETLARFEAIDVWINNVGQGITRPPSQLTDDDVDEIMRVNVKSALYGMQEVLPHFR